MESKSIQLDFLGEKISLKSQNNSTVLEEVVALAEYKLKDAQKRAKGAAPHKVALLALMDLAEDYIQSKTKTTELKKEIAHKSQHLIQLLDSELAQ